MREADVLIYFPLVDKIRKKYYAFISEKLLEHIRCADKDSALTLGRGQVRSDRGLLLYRTQIRCAWRYLNQSVLLQQRRLNDITQRN